MGAPWEDYQNTSDNAAPWEDYAAKNVNTQQPIVAAQPQEESFWGDLKNAGSKFVEGISRPEPSAVRSFSPTIGAALNVAGNAGNLLTNVVGAGIRSAYRALPKTVQEGVGSVGKMIADNPIVDLAKTAYGQMPQDVRNDLGNIAGASVIVPAAAGVRATLPLAKKTLATVGEKTGVRDALSSVRQVIAPTPTKDEALGQILQGGTKDIARGEKALGVTNLNGVKTYGDLSNRLEKIIPEYVSKVDDELLKDRGIYKLDDLGTAQTTKPVSDASGKVIIPSQTVQVNHVEDALNQLAELYNKIGDKALAKDAENVLEKAKIAGLSKKEVNDIARQYNAEFGSKAFSKGANREPLTSVNAQAFENTRSGLKEVARRGLSSEAQEFDATLSSIYNTKQLIDKNVEAVNRLRQKVDQRGLGVKVGRGLWTALDTATMGVIRGAAMKMLPRNVGLKTKNWLDIEDSLRRNLDILDKYK